MITLKIVFLSTWSNLDLGTFILQHVQLSYWYKLKGFLEGTYCSIEGNTWFFSYASINLAADDIRLIITFILNLVLSMNCDECMYPRTRAHTFLTLRFINVIVVTSAQELLCWSLAQLFLNQARILLAFLHTHSPFLLSLFICPWFQLLVMMASPGSTGAPLGVGCAAYYRYLHRALKKETLSKDNVTKMFLLCFLPVFNSGLWLSSSIYSLPESVPRLQTL